MKDGGQWRSHESMKARLKRLNNWESRLDCGMKNIENLRHISVTILIWSNEFEVLRQIIEKSYSGMKIKFWSESKPIKTVDFFLFWLKLNSYSAQWIFLSKFNQLT